MDDSGKEPRGPAPGLGSKVGRYRIDRALGMGGMASVYRGTAPDGTPVAVKVMHPATLLPDDRRRFGREYDALSKMDHPNVVRVYETGVADDHYPWIAMEFIDGSDLERAAEVWRDDPPDVRWPRVERVLRGLCEGLQYVHDQGLVHRDLKPTNVLLTKDGVPKLSDFGVVKDPNASGTQLTKAGRLVGTVAFMAPEQITGDTIDHRADLYSLGAVLYVLLTGRRPIEAKSIAGYLARHLTEVPKAPGQIDSTVPQSLEKICMRLLAKEPERRFPTSRAVIQTLDRPVGDPKLPLRGRDAVLAHFGRRLGSLAEGRTGVIAVTGPEGSGRTFLLGALAEEARAREVQVVRTTPDTLIAALGERSGAKGAATVVLVDDLDTLPDRDAEAVARAVREARNGVTRPLLVVYTAIANHGRLGDLASGTGTGAPADQVMLEPLDRNAVVTMLRDRGITGPAAPVLGKRLEEDFGGMPGAIQEQIVALLEAGVLEHDGESVKVHGPVKELRAMRFPVPAGVRKRLEARLAATTPLERELVEGLALLDRPSGAGLLEATVSDPGAASRALDALVRQGLLRRRIEEAEEAQETVEFAHPSAAGVVRDLIEPGRKRARHQALAKALNGRLRRDSAWEVARHLMLAGDVGLAWPMFVKAARRAARAGLFLDVLEITRQAESIRKAAEPAVAPEERVRNRRWLAMLEGEAELARGHWADALAPLERAVEAARGEGDPAALSRCLGSLGRAHYRAGAFEKAAPLLEESLKHVDPGAPERAAATRALADIRLREGQIEEARRLWQESLDLAVEAGSRDSEARARRGLAHVAALQGHLSHAADLLDAADDLLKLGGDDRVRAGVMARALELDLVGGRYGNAVLRAETLVELARSREMAERLPEACALQAEALAAVGRGDEARVSARDAVAYAKAQGPGAWEAAIRAARVLCDLGDDKAAQAALPDPDRLPASRVDDPSAQLAVLRARILAAERPLDARDLAHWALVRPAPLLGIRAARLALDAAKALARAGDTEASRTSAKRGLRVLDGPGGDGLRLDLLLAFHAASPDARILGAAGQVAARLVESLPASLAEGFRTRPEIASCLAAPRP